MRKTISFALLAIILFSSTSVHAMSEKTRLSKIASLTSSIQKLQIQLKSLQAQLATLTGSSVSATPDPTVDLNNPGATVPTFVARKIGATIYKGSGIYSGYGSYGFELVVTAGDKDVYIPRSTSDSTSGLTGLSYSATGQEFRGTRNSEVSCSPVSNGYCHVKAGSTSTLKFTVWLMPDLAGGYGVSFSQLSYLLAGETDPRTFKIGQKTEAIYVQ